MTTNRRTFQASLRAAAIATSTMTLLANAEPVSVWLRTVDAEAAAGRLISFSLDEGLRLEPTAGGESPTIPAQDIVELSASSVETRESDVVGAAVVGLTGHGGQDRLVGDILAFKDDQVEIDTRSLGPLRVPLDWIATWRKNQPEPAAIEEAIHALFTESAQGRDRLLTGNGDRLVGVVTAIDWEGISIEISGAVVRLPQTRLVAAAIVSAPIDDGARLTATIDLLDGSRITTGELNWDAGGVVAVILDGLRIRIATSEIVRIRIAGGRWQWLTQLQPISVEQTPMMSIDWPFAIDRNVMGGSLLCGQQAYEHGIGVHSRTLLTYDLAAAYRSFTTSYGMDDDSGPMADVSIEIRVDGELRHTNPSVRRGDPAGPIQLNVTGSKRIDLIVNFGRFGGVEDRFNWLDPALVR